MRAFLLRHRHLAVALGLGAVLRLITMLGYRPAMWFNDSYEYVSVALHPRPHPIRPDGYGFWLLLLKPFHSFSLVVFTQHVMGLATAVLIYALLIRKFDLPRWGATLTVTPVIFDAYQIQLEHLIMSDTMFTLLVVGVITLILWHRRMSARMGVVVGLLLALTALTRSIGLPILALVVAYLLVKRVGWRPIVAVVTACAIPVLAYMAWFKSAHGRFAMTNSDGLILYMRTMAFADCNKIKPKEVQLIVLCTTQRKDYSQWYLWDPSGPPHRYGTPKFDGDVNEWASKFAKEAILAQPLDYLAVVARDFFRAFRWDRPVFPDANTYNQYEFRNEEKPLPTWPLYKGRADTDAMAYEQGPAATRIIAPWANVMQAYQRVVRLPGLVLGVILLIGLYGVAVRWRNLGGPVALPWLGRGRPDPRPGGDRRVRLPLPAARGAARLPRGRDQPAPRGAAARVRPGPARRAAAAGRAVPGRPPGACPPRRGAGSSRAPRPPRRCPPRSPRTSPRTPPASPAPRTATTARPDRP